MNGVTALQGVFVSASSEVNFGVDSAVPAAPVAAAASGVSDGAASSLHPGCNETAAQPEPTPTDLHPDRAPVVDAPDYAVYFDPTSKAWRMKWKWTDGAEPECLQNTVAQYRVPCDARREFDDELKRWVEQGWLIPYNESELGPPKGLVPLMAVQQKNKSKTVMIENQRHCLTRLGYGLCVAPLVMKAVIRTVLERDADVNRAVLPYVDDLLVNEDIVSAERVVAHLANFGLECKPPERAAGGARLLGLRVSRELGRLVWSRDNPVGPPPAVITRRGVFSWCGRLIAHMPVCGWLRPAVAWLKRRVNDVTQGWDDITYDGVLQKQISHVAARVASHDPAHGLWSVRSDRAVVWVDASSVAAGVVVESPDGDVIEDGCWLRKDESTHINVAELNAAVRGINVAVAWDMRVIDLRTDSVTVHRWINDALSGRTRLRTKAHGEMLIRRRVDMIRQLVDELELSLSVTLVRSAANRADELTRVPKDWY
ncbi:uncharacterized protein LOC122386889 [Amphibalanus amphitrite]|uniref:uncharacterized protein LOC122386889 n=1 Tax=Amphibalanus amphitrite TaxID=1232801 RepID=UPI001C901B9F|nr:uncharacterized protein LOC122386889 [Amphibalanus amphitrite]